MFILAMLLVAGIVGIGLWRRIRLPHLSRQLGIAGLAALALALADVKWQNEPRAPARAARRFKMHPY
jgi:hypothetical protein